MFEMILNTPLINAFQYGFEKTLFFAKNKTRVDIYKELLACTCQGGGKVRIIASQFSYCEINLIFCKVSLCKKLQKWEWGSKISKTAKMGIKAVEDKEKTKNLTSFRNFWKLNFIQ